MESVIQVKENFQEILKENIKEIFKPDDIVAIKLNMGEKGNTTHLKPAFIKEIVDVLLELKIKPFLFDSPVAYKGGRDTPEKYLKTAEDNGFTKKSIGCDIIVSDESIDVKGPHMNYNVCKALKEADCLLVVSHVKGHECCAFGGAIKNLGMGGVSSKTKEEMHNASIPVLDAEKCNVCETCVNICPSQLIKVERGKIKLTKEGCYGCGVCILNCPKSALKPQAALFDTLLAESAEAVLRGKEKLFFINSLTNITRRCDCYADSGEILLKDLGIIMSKDPVAIDQASIDLINHEAGKDIFKEVHKKSPELQIKEAETLGIGSRNYKMI